jgi:plastocyanin
MKKIIYSIMLFSIGTAGFCAKWTVTNSGLTFSPATITITVGDSVQFNISSMHNAVEVSQATWNVNGTTPLPGFSVPFGGGMVLPALLTVGTHYYVCTAHASSGMKGTIIVQNSTGIDENPVKTNFSVYPNPSRGIFQMAINNSQPAKSYTVEIYDLAGNMVWSKSSSEQQTTAEIDLTGLIKGMYFIRFFNGTETYTRKIIIQ